MSFTAILYLFYHLVFNISYNFVFQILPGNTNTYLVVEQKLDPVLLASKIRFVPYSVHVRTVCMRVELLGCPWKGKLVSLGF